MISTGALDALDRTLRLCAQELVGRNSLAPVAIARSLLGTRVAIVADARNLASPAGQTAMVALAQLCSGYGAGVRLVCPEQRLVVPQPPVRGELLRRGILALLADGVPSTFACAAPVPAAADLVFLLGDTPWAGDERTAWRLSGDAYSGRLSPANEPVVAWDDVQPFGALVAALLAAAEPLKDAIRRLAPACSEPLDADVLAPTRSATFGFPVIDARTLRPTQLDFISGGAIVSACLHALLRVPGLRATMRVIEPDVVELSNLNRYPLARRSDLGVPKVSMLRQYATDGISIKGVVARFEPAALRALTPLAPLVIVGADSLPARWLAQAQRPSWLGVGATGGFFTVTSEHAGSPCVGCLHPHDDRVSDDPTDALPVIPTVSFVSYWSGLVLAFRVLAQASGHPLPAEAQVLELTPLHLDNRASHKWRRLPLHPDCPLQCSGVNRAA